MAIFLIFSIGTAALYCLVSDPSRLFQFEPSVRLCTQASWPTFFGSAPPTTKLANAGPPASPVIEAPLVHSRMPAPKVHVPVPGGPPIVAVADVCVVTPMRHPHAGSAGVLHLSGTFTSSPYTPGTQASGKPTDPSRQLAG